MSKDDRFFLYLYCNGLDVMREFYSSLLGLDEIFHASGPDGGLGYLHGSVQITIYPAADELPVDSQWHRQPGWDGGTKASTSWSFQLSEMATFRRIVERLLMADTPRFYPKPQWHGYWSFPVKDPMGNTIEVTHAPAEEPSNEEWSMASEAFGLR
jgi:hypothetical protein